MIKITEWCGAALGGEDILKADIYKPFRSWYMCCLHIQNMQRVCWWWEIKVNLWGHELVPLVNPISELFWLRWVSKTGSVLSFFFFTFTTINSFISANGEIWSTFNSSNSNSTCSSICTYCLQHLSTELYFFVFYIPVSGCSFWL